MTRFGKIDLLLLDQVIEFCLKRETFGELVQQKLLQMKNKSQVESVPSNGPRMFKVVGITNLIRTQLSYAVQLNNKLDCLFK